jgi:hypothetical protein
VTEKNVAAGLNSPERTVGLNGLVQLAVIRQSPVTLQLAPGVARIHLALPVDVALLPTAPITYRIFGGEAGLEFDRNGQIVEVRDVKLPLELRYRPRIYPTPPAQGQLSLDLSFWYQDGTGVSIQDVQWRQPIVWAKSGATAFDLRFPGPDSNRKA